MNCWQFIGISCSATVAKEGFIDEGIVRAAIARPRLYLPV